MMLRRILAGLFAVTVALLGVDAPAGAAIPGDPGPGPGTYQLIDDGAFDPCQPVSYGINPDGLSPAFQDDIHAVFGEVARITGMTFTFTGLTPEPPSQTRESGSPMILLGSLAMSANTDGVAGPGSYAYFNVANRSLPTGFDAVSWGQIILHEVGHAVGLGHVDNTGEVMYPEGFHRSGLGYGPGDTWGLRNIGLEGGCRSPGSRGQARDPLGAITLSGIDGRGFGALAYAFDPDTGAPARIRVTVQGVSSKEYEWNYLWDDMPQFTGLKRHEAFVFLAQLPPGERTVCFDAQDSRDGWTSIGCRRVSVK